MNIAMHTSKRIEPIIAMNFEITVHPFALAAQSAGNLGVGVPHPAHSSYAGYEVSLYAEGIGSCIKFAATGVLGQDALQISFTNCGQ